MRLPETFTEWALVGILALLFLLFVKAFEILSVLRKTAARDVKTGPDDRADIVLAVNRVEVAVTNLEHAIREIARVDAEEAGRVN